MLKKVCFALLLAICGTAVSAQTAQAGLLSQLLSFDGAINELDDASRGNIIQGSNVGNDQGLLDTGDVIQGVIEFGSVINQGAGTTQYVPPNNSLYGLYALEVVSTEVVFEDTFIPGLGTVPLPFTILSFSAVVTDPTLSLMSLLTGGDPLTTFDISNQDFYGSSSDYADAAFAIISKTGVGTPLSSSFDGDEPRFDTDGNDWNVDLIGGLVSSDDFYEVKIQGLAAPGTLAPGQEAGYRAGFSVISHDMDPAVKFLPSDINSFSDEGTTTYHDIVTTLTDNSISGLTASNPNPPGFDFVDDGNFYVRVVPEPISLLGWGGMALSGLGFGFARRRKTAAKA